MNIKHIDVKNLMRLPQPDLRDFLLNLLNRLDSKYLRMLQLIEETKIFYMSRRALFKTIMGLLIHFIHDV